MLSPALIEELNAADAKGSAIRRAEVVQRITDLFLGGAANYSDDQIDLFDDVFIRIAATIELSARVMLAHRLAQAPRAPAAITRVLASDDEIDVAGPVLEQSVRLDRDTLLATARSKSQRHLLAISRRTSLDETLTDVLVERGDKSVVLSTVANPAARFSESGYGTLVRRSEGDDEIATGVGLRHDIPRQHLLRLLVRASHAVQLKLATANPAMSDMIRDAVAQAATTILDKTSAASRDYAAARARIEPLHAGHRLGEADVAGFAAANRFEETTVALALLCRLPIEEVERAMSKDQPDAVLIMARAIGLSWQTAKAVLRMRAGTGGISPGELDQCLATFSRLSPATARQVIRFRDGRAQGARWGQAGA
jgi:uncharacterized protein (DUF2336 family)